MIVGPRSSALASGFASRTTSAVISLLMLAMDRGSLVPLRRPDAARRGAEVLIGPGDADRRGALHRKGDRGGRIRRRNMRRLRRDDGCAQRSVQSPPDVAPGRDEHQRDHDRGDDPAPTATCAPHRGSTWARAIGELLLVAHELRELGKLIRRLVLRRHRAPSVISEIPSCITAEGTTNQLLDPDASALITPDAGCGPRRLAWPAARRRSPPPDAARCSRRPRVLARSARPDRECDAPKTAPASSAPRQASR